MADSVAEEFVDQLKQDTLSGAAIWSEVTLAPKGYFVKKMSYESDESNKGYIYLVERRFRGCIEHIEYRLYIQRNEFEDCLSVNVKRSSLIELSTIIRNVMAGNTTIQEAQAQELMRAYLAGVGSDKF